jgi:hypothetical protein
MKSRDEQTEFSIKPIIYHQKKIIYVHVPKNASSTIRDCLFGRQKDLEYVLYKDANSYRNYLRFTFVRNPYDRFLSFYKDNLKGDMLNEGECRSYRAFGRLGSIDNLINHVMEYDDSELDYHLKPQSWFIQGIDLDFICYVENFDRDMESLKWILGINKPHKHLRQTENKYSLNDRQKEMIYKRYEEDFRRFNYAR